MHHLKNDDNSVNGIPGNSRDASLGTVAHAQQVAPGRHQATVCISAKQTLTIGTWNARIQYQSGKLDNVKQEMTRLEVKVLGIYETRWTGSKEFISNDFRMIHSGGEKHVRGVALIMDKECAKSLAGW